MRQRDKTRRFAGLRLLLAALLAASLLGAFPAPTFAESGSNDANAADAAGVIGVSTEQCFQLTVGITAANTTFILPTSSYLNGTNNGKDYDWSIDWGDGTTQLAAGTSGYGEGVYHLYSTADSYTIQISPNGSTEAWLAAFGFDIGSSRSSSAANKGLVTAVNGPLTPQMTRSTNQIEGTAAAPSYEWTNLFNNCPNIVTGPTIEGWDQVRSAGDNFAQSMFSGCSSLASLPTGFNLPPGITSVAGSFASSMFNACTSLASLPAGFNLPQGITTTGDYFAYNMFQRCSSLESLPTGFNLPQSITNVGANFAYGMFSNCSSLVTLPAGFNLPQSITNVGANFTAFLFRYCSSLAYLPNGFNLPQKLESIGSAFAAGMFYGCTSLAALPAGFSYQQNLIDVDGNFAYAMFYNCASLTTLPEGFNLPQGIITAGDGFAEYMFWECTSLTTLPEGFNLPQELESVGSWFAVRMFYRCTCLTTLPEGFNLPQNVYLTDEDFAVYLFLEAGSSTFQLNAEFCLPAGLPAASANAFYETFQLSKSAPMQNRTAASIIGGCPTPSSLRNTFDAHFSDIDYIAVNWGGGGLTPPSVGAPGSGDINGDGYVTMNEVLTCAQAALGDIGLSPTQLDAIDMDRDGVITMADVMLIYKASVQ